jgi:hypothetical protein
MRRQVFFEQAKIVRGIDIEERRKFRDGQAVLHQSLLQRLPGSRGAPG